jgi:WD40 repeat protein
MKSDNEAVLCVAFSQDGKWFASGGEGGPVILWSMATKRELARFRETGIETPMFVRQLAFSPDGKLLAWQGGGNKLLVWSTETKKVIRRFDSLGERRIGNSVAFSPDGKTLAVGGYAAPLDKKPMEIWLMDVQRWKTKTTLKGPGTCALSIAMNGDGTMLAASGFDGVICVWPIKKQGGEPGHCVP